MTPPFPVLLMVRKLDQGGCERDLSRIALGLDRTRFQPHVGCFRKEGIRVDELSRAGVPILELPVLSLRSGGAIRCALQLRRYIRSHRIRLVHAYDVPTAMYAAPAVRFLTPGVRFVSSQLSYRTLYSPAEHKILRNITDRLANRVHVNCRAMEQHMTDEGLPAERAYLCYNGVDGSVFHPRAGARIPEVQDAQLVIGTIANLREEKAIDRLIQAFAQVRREDLNRGLKLLIVGSGPSEEGLKALAARLDLGNACVFLPAKPDIADEMRSLDVFVIPSLSEAFPNALLEAMACGCAVIGSNVGGVPELIQEGETGLLSRPGDVSDLAGKLDRLIGSEELRRRCGANALRVAQKFSVARAVECMSGLYASLIDGDWPTAHSPH